MNQPAPPLSLPHLPPTPNAELAAEIAQALHEAGLIAENDQTLCQNMLNGVASADANAWRMLIEMPLYASKADLSNVV